MVATESLASSDSAWALHDARVRGQSGHAWRADDSVQLANAGFCCGGLDAKLAEAADAALRNLDHRPLMAGDLLPGFSAWQNSAAAIEALNCKFTFRELDAKATWMVAEVLDSVRDRVAACIGSPWRTLNVKVWIAAQGSVEGGAGVGRRAPDGIFTLLLVLTGQAYGSDMGGEQGVALDDGAITLQGGQVRWVLLPGAARALRVPHAGKGEFCFAEVAICRAVEFTTRPRFAGLNALWPEYPWLDALDGLDARSATERMRRATPIYARSRHRAGVLATEVTLYSLVPAAMLVGAISRLMRVPATAGRLQSIVGHARNGTMRVVAENIYNAMSNGRRI